MYHIVTPLAVSSHVPDMWGELHCFSLHQQAINLTNINQQIITLHRHNSLSPMGWLLKSDDFDDIYDYIDAGEVAVQTPDGDLLIGDIQLNKHHRQLILNTDDFQSDRLDFVEHLPVPIDLLNSVLSSVEVNTGLYGLLSNNIEMDLPTELDTFIQQFQLLLTAQPYDLKPYIGLGPGLTPSYDDMIVGILAMLHSDRLLDKSRLIQTLNLSLKQLELLTTKISATFLTYAINGLFSLNLLTVIKRIRQRNYNRQAIVTSIHELLRFGHTSGADVLLGIWLGSLILERYQHKKGNQYVRS